jgi:ELWxxDGT repeat protein
VEFTNVNGTLFFTADDGVTGYELWKSDGTADGTTLVKDIHSGVGSSFPQGLTVVNDTLFFTADDGVSGAELWKSDGTADGTILVKDINPGGERSGPGFLTAVNVTLLFVADDGVSGYELWRSDGTAAGTILVKEFWPGSSNEPLPVEFTNVNGTLFFQANDGVTGGELWRSDGTAAGTILVKDIQPGTESSSPENLTAVNGTLFFWSGRFGTDVTNRGLWKSDGTADGTILVKDIWPYSGMFHTPPSSTAVNGTLFFEGFDSTSGTGAELWRSDGTAAGTTLVKDILPGSEGSDPRHLTAVNDTLFFSADGGVTGRELWALPVQNEHFYLPLLYR